MSVTDSNNNAAKFDITVIAPTLEFDFTQGSLNSLDGNYAVTFVRASTGTYFDANGVMQIAAVNQPRYDYNPKTHAALGLLIESTKTNMIINSQVDQWTPEFLTLTADQGTALDGSMTADKIKATGGFPRARINFTPVSGTKYVLSVYVKMLVGTNLSLRYEDSGDIWPI